MHPILRGRPSCELDLISQNATSARGQSPASAARRRTVCRPSGAPTRRAKRLLALRLLVGRIAHRKPPGRWRSGCGCHGKLANDGKVRLSALLPASLEGRPGAPVQHVSVRCAANGSRRVEVVGCRRDRLGAGYSWRPAVRHPDNWYHQRRVDRQRRNLRAIAWENARRRQQASPAHQHD
jgi:hypothetical protein